VIEFTRTSYKREHVTFAPPKEHEALPEVEVVSEKPYDEEDWRRARTKFAFNGSFPSPLSPAETFALSQVLAVASVVGREMDVRHGFPPEEVPS